LSILPIYLYGTDILRKKAKPVSTVTDDVIALIMDMFETMHNANGIGLAANQVGRTERVIVVDISDLEETKHIKPITLINPEILSQDGTRVLEEGCLSIPDVRGEVERAESIIVRFRDTNFAQQELQASGLLARVILHEVDHLNGVLFIDHLPKEKKREWKKTLKKIQKGEVEVNYPVISAATVPA
jgi:peptide deformylase